MQTSRSKQPKKQNAKRMHENISKTQTATSQTQKTIKTQKGNINKTQNKNKNTKATYKTNKNNTQNKASAKHIISKKAKHKTKQKTQ